jgi:hypothetical protein
MIGDKLQKIESWLLEIKPESMQSITQLIELGAQLSQYIAFTGGEVARLKGAYLVAKKAAYHSAMNKLKEEGKEVAPSLVKDYVGTMVGEKEERWLLADRLNAAMTHQLDFVRTCISALKTEMQTINNYNN